MGEVDEKIRKEIGDFLGRNWEDGFEMWLSCIMDIEMTVKTVVPYDVKTGLPDSLLYETGVKSGGRVCSWLFDNFDLKKKDIRERACYTDAFFSRIGVGEIEFVKEGENRLLRFKGGTFFSRKQGNVGRKVCHYIAGFIAGVTSCCIGRKYEAEEVRCVSNGDAHCDFIVKPKVTH